MGKIKPKNRKHGRECKRHQNYTKKVDCHSLPLPSCIDSFHRGNRCYHFLSILLEAFSAYTSLHAYRVPSTPMHIQMVTNVTPCSEPCFFSLYIGDSATSIHIGQTCSFKRHEKILWCGCIIMGLTQS